MRRFWAFLCAFLLLCAVACGTEEVPKGENPPITDGEQKSYTIELDIGAVANANYTLSVTSITVNHGDKIELPTPSCPGFTFKYWSYKSAAFTDTVFMLDKDIVLVAEWKETDWPDNF